MIPTSRKTPDGKTPAHPRHIASILTLGGVRKDSPLYPTLQTIQTTQKSQIIRMTRTTQNTQNPQEPHPCKSSG